MPAAPIRANDGLSVAMLVLGAIVVVGDVLSAVTSFVAVDAYDRAVAEGRDPAEVITLYDATGLLQFLPLVPAWILTGLWLQRARSNAEVVEPGAQRRSPAWSFLGWVVPVVSLWFPKQIVDDSWRVTAQATGSRPRRTGGWWAAWIIYLVLGNAVGRSVWSGDGAHQGVVPGLEVAVAVTSVLAFALWLPVVRGLTDTQSRLAARTG